MMRIMKLLEISDQFGIDIDPGLDIKFFGSTPVFISYNQVFIVLGSFYTSVEYMCICHSTTPVIYPF